MEWSKPLLVFTYGYGACFMTLLIIMFSIVVAKKIVGWTKSKKKAQHS